MYFQILITISAIVFIFHTAFRFLDSLHMFQQNVYDTKRYFSWMKDNSDKVLPLTELLPLAAWSALFFSPSQQTLMIVVVGIALFYLLRGYLLYKGRKGYTKLPLVMTARAKRLTITSSILIGVCFLLAAMYTPTYVKLGNLFVFQTCILVNIFVYLFVWIANVINSPVEKWIRSKFMDEAKVKIAALEDKIEVVGITGSFGKTTTKNIVTHLLNQDRYALMTPASYNTPMGLTITIREMLKPIHDVFVAEMGAYKPGEIAELAELVSPKYGILTAIGPQHLNTFKTIENIQKTKFELIESLSEDGVAVLNIDEPLIRDYEIQSKCKKLTYSIENDQADFYAKEITYSDAGMTLTIVFPDKKEAKVSTELLGTHNAQNILAGVAVAYDMGIAEDVITKSIATLPQVEHRLQLKKSGNFTIIDDAFNANPVGTKAAVDVLAKMPGKKIVLTPGMIELGERQDELNEEYGRYMADKVDRVILVGATQTKPIYNGLITTMLDEQIIVTNNLQEAFAKMYEEITPGSYVLIANDLPDIYNE